MNKVVLFSGGQDSLTCAVDCLWQGHDLYLLTINYGQKHRIEVEAALNLTILLRYVFIDRIITSEHISLPIETLKSTSPLVNKDEELDTYTNYGELRTSGIEKTFVPMRNALFLTIAANRAVAENCSTIVTGVCQADYGGYPDCRETFIAAQSVTILTATEKNIYIETPLIDYTKKDEAKKLFDYGMKIFSLLAFSHTAYDGSYPPVGNDHASMLRARGFEEAGLPDPLLLRANMTHNVPLPDTKNYTYQVTNRFIWRYIDEYDDVLRRLKNTK